MVSLKVMVAAGRGDLDSARAIIRMAQSRIDPGVLYPFFAGYQDMYWVLDDAEQREVLAPPPGAFDDDRGSWGLVRAGLYQLRGDRRRMQIYADSARLALEEQLRAEPDDWQRHSLLGLALAYLGRKPEAVREGQRGVQLMPVSRDAYFGPSVSCSWCGFTCSPASRTWRSISSSPCSGCPTIIPRLAPDRSHLRSVAEAPPLSAAGPVGSWEVGAGLSSRA